MENSSKFGACFSASTCSDSEKSTANCWIFIICQIVFSALLFITLFIMHKSKRGDDEKIIVSTGRHKFLEMVKKQLSRHGRSSLTDEKNQPSIYSLEPISETKRSEHNFMKNVADTTILYPAKSRPEYVPTSHLHILDFIKTITFVAANDEYIQTRMISCASLALLSSAASSTLAMLFKHERNIRGCMAGLGQMQDCMLDTKEWFMGHVGPFAEAIDSFKFLPVFLILAYIAFLVNRWRDFMITSHTIQGRIQDVGILVGSVPDNPVTKEEKKQIYKIYRFLNAVHIMCYKSFMRDEFKNDDQLISQLIEMDLLTEEEGIRFGSMGKKVREGLCSRILCEIDVLLSLTTKKYAESKSIVLNDKICDLRGTMAKLHDTFVRDNPNEYILAMQVLVYCYILLIITGYPILMFSDNNAAFSCVQPLAFFGTFFTLVSLQMPFILFERLDNPFDAHDDINAENLVASTELALFISMRSQFEANDAEKDIMFASVSTLGAPSATSLPSTLSHKEESFKEDPRGGRRSRSVFFK